MAETNRMGNASGQGRKGAHTMTSILQDWVTELGLRHQGVLLTAIRGCDTVPKHHVSKSLARAIRREILNAHCGDASKSSSFIEDFDPVSLSQIMKDFSGDLDSYPLHYVMHVVHAVEIIGYYLPDCD